MKLFKSKESFKEKLIQTIIEKPHGQEGFYFSLGFVRKMLIFVGKHLRFYPKDVCSFSDFLFKWREVKQTSMSNKICRKWNF